MEKGTGRLFQDMGFDEQIEFLRRSSIGTPKRINIDLGVAHNDFELGVAGNFFYIINASTGTVTVDIKVNNRREPSFTFTQQLGLITPFDKLFYTNAVQAGATMVIMYGTLAPTFLNIIDNRGGGAPVNLLTQIRDELMGDLAPEGWGVVAVGAVAGVAIAQNANRKSLFIQHNRNGVGIIYLGLDNTVTNNNHWVSLAVGEWWSIDDYRGAVWAIRSAGATTIMHLEV